MKDDTVELGGKTYISSIQAAKEMGYTKDYVGQLARAGKIDAKLIGRSWYVSEESLKDHKGSVNYTLTKPKKVRKESDSREPEKGNVDIGILSSSPERVRTSGSSHVTYSSQAGDMQDVSDFEVVQGGGLSKSEVSSRDTLEPFVVPIRTQRPQYEKRDVLLSSNFEYEPGEPLHYENEETYPRVQKVARFEQVPIVSNRSRSSVQYQRPVSQKPTPIRGVAAGIRQRSVRMDGVITARPTHEKILGQSVRPQTLVRSQSVRTPYRSEQMEDVSSYGTVSRKKKISRVPWLMLLLVLTLIAGLSFIVWILFLV